ncbi:MAG: hypothetical protein WDA00_03715 [Eubacteriales bacterium]
MQDERVMWKFLQGMKGKWMILLFAILGIALVAYGGSLSNRGERPDPAADGGTLQEAERYRAALEAELEALCGRIRGVGEVHIMVTLEGGGSYRYSGSTLTGSDMPAVRGVAVVCSGGGDPAVALEVSALLTSLLGIGSHRVHVSAMK